MGLPEQIMIELQAMNDNQRREVLDFARFLRMKEQRELESLMDSLIDENIEALTELAK